MDDFQKRRENLLKGATTSTPTNSTQSTSSFEDRRKQLLTPSQQATQQNKGPDFFQGAVDAIKKTAQTAIDTVTKAFQPPAKIVSPLPENAMVKPQEPGLLQKVQNTNAQFGGPLNPIALGINTVNIIDSAFKNLDTGIKVTQDTIYKAALNQEQGKANSTDKNVMAIAKPLAEVQQKVIEPALFNKATAPIVKGFAEQYLGSSKQVMDTLNTKVPATKNKNLAGYNTLGELAGSTLAFLAGGEIVKGLELGAASLPVLFGALGQTSTPANTTINQRLAKLPVDMFAGWLLSKVPAAKNILSVEALKNAGIAATVVSGNALVDSLIQGLPAKEAATTAAKMAIIAGLFHIGGTATGLFINKSLESKYGGGTIEMTPEQARAQANATDLAKPDAVAARDVLIKAARQAQTEGKNLSINLGVAKKSAVASLFNADTPQGAHFTVDLVEPTKIDLLSSQGGEKPAETPPTSPTDNVPPIIGNELNKNQNAGTDIPLSKIQVVESGPRSSGASQTNGPIDVVLNPDTGKYEIQDGATRFDEAKARGDNTIKVNIIHATPVRGESGDITGWNPINGEIKVPDTFRTPTEEAAYHQIASEPNKIVSDYLAENPTEIDPDKLRTYFTSYQGHNVVDFNRPLGQLKDQVYNHLLETQKGQGNNTVLFTAGGSGSGKTLGLASLPEVDKKDFPIVLDSTFSYQSAPHDISKALENGYKAKIVYVLRDPIDAWVNGVLPRIKSEGRIVTEGYFIKTHEKAREQILSEYEKYKNNPDVSFEFIDNTNGAGRIEATTIDKVKNFSYDKAKAIAEITVATEKAYEQGQLTKEEYEASKADRSSPSTQNGGRNEPKTPEPKTKVIQPDLNKKASRVYQKVADLSQGRFKKDYLERVSDPDRYHTPEEATNSKGIKIGDKVSYMNKTVGGKELGKKTGYVVSIEDMTGTHAYDNNGGVAIQVIGPNHYGSFYSLNEVTKVGDNSKTTTPEAKKKQPITKPVVKTPEPVVKKNISFNTKEARDIQAIMIDKIEKIAATANNQEELIKNAETLIDSTIEKAKDNPEVLKGIRTALNKEMFNYVGGNGNYRAAYAELKLTMKENPDIGDYLLMLETKISEIDDLLIGPPEGNQNRDKSVTLSSGINPGLDKFFEEDVKPIISNVVGAAQQTYEAINPPRGSVASRETANIVRNALAQIDNHRSIIQNRFLKYEKFFNKYSDAQNVKNITEYEKTGHFAKEPRANKGDESYSKLYHDSMVTSYADLRAAYGRDEEGFIDNYVRRAFIFRDEANAAKGVSYLTNYSRSLSANKSPLKQRVLDMPLSDALQNMVDRGIKVKMASTNPEELRQWSLMNAKRAIVFAQAWKDFKAGGLIKYVPRGGIIPEGMIKLEDRAAQIFAPAEVHYPIAGTIPMEFQKKGYVTTLQMGSYYADPKVARILNNTISRGLEGTKLFEAARIMENSLNQLQLGLSAFHFTGSALNASFSDIALGLRNYLQFKPIAGTMKITRGLVPFASFSRDVYNGNKFIDQLKNNSPEAYAIMEKYLNPAGGRLTRDTKYNNQAAKHLMRALTNGNLVGATFQIPHAIAEISTNWLMGYSIPRVKLGAFLDLAENTYNRLPANATIGQKREALQRAWNSIDNRFGQLVYDNLFWNKTGKDVAMLVTRSVGWNLGDIRELGKGILVDPWKTTLLGRDRIAKNVGERVTDRMLFAISLILGVSIISAIYQYLHTGTGPQELKDYFFPKNGLVDANGNPDRSSMPTYWKDIYAFANDPISTVEHKASPLIDMAFSLISNKDYYGNLIRNPNDAVGIQLSQAGQYLLNAIAPFSLQQFNKQLGLKATPEQLAESFMGIVKAPGSVIQSDKQKALLKAYEQQSGLPSPKTPEQVATANLKAKARQEIQKNGVGNSPSYKELVKNGTLNTMRKRADFLKTARLTGMQRILRVIPRNQRQQFK